MLAKSSSKYFLFSNTTFLMYFKTQFFLRLVCSKFVLWFMLVDLRNAVQWCPGGHALQFMFILFLYDGNLYNKPAFVFYYSKCSAELVFANFKYGFFVTSADSGAFNTRKGRQLIAEDDIFF